MVHVSDICDQTVNQRFACGGTSITQAECVALGCCYSSSGSVNCFLNYHGDILSFVLRSNFHFMFHDT